MIPERVRRKRMADGCLSNVVKYALFLTNFLIFVSKFGPSNLLHSASLKSLCGDTLLRLKYSWFKKVFTDFLAGTHRETF